ncbi:MAG: S24/S26 family peptidase [Clostridia bacterium]|nr:S24/S26 family peptidase [Clostridia bacterium]
MPKVNMETLLPFIQEAFNRGVDFQIPITGTSMNPLLYQNRDFVKIVKPDLPLKTGDIPLYRRNDGAFVLHRVVGIKENGEYIMCGDNQFVLEYGITDKNIIGVAKKLIIDGKEIDVDSDADYLKHKEKFLKNIRTRYPGRRLRCKLSSVKRRFF